MDKQELKVSKLFVPKQWDRFIMKRFIESHPDYNSSEYNDDVEMGDISVPTRIIDAWIINNEYKEFIKELRISKFNNEHAILVIKEQIHKHSNKEEIDGSLIAGLFDEEDAKDPNELFETQSKINAIFLWITTRLWLPSIAFKVGI